MAIDQTPDFDPFPPSMRYGIRTPPEGVLTGTLATIKARPVQRHRARRARGLGDRERLVRCLWFVALAVLMVLSMFLGMVISSGPTQQLPTRPEPAQTPGSAPAPTAGRVGSLLPSPSPLPFS